MSDVLAIEDQHMVVSVDAQAELDALSEHVCWADSETIAFVGDTAANHLIFPQDVSQSGYVNWNIKVLLYVGHTRGSHLEILLVDCDEFSATLFRDFSVRGRVDSLKRVEVDDREGQRILRCSRMMYRFVSVDQSAGRLYYGFGVQQSARADVHRDRLCRFLNFEVGVS